MKPKKEKEDLFKHARYRAQERYGLELTPELYAEYNRQIARGMWKPIFRESFSRTHHLLEEQFIVVFNHRLGAICTFLPPENINAYLTGN